MAVESVKFGERCFDFRSANPEPSRRETEGVETRRQTHCDHLRCEGIVQTTNSKEAAKAEVVSIIPWLGVRIPPVLLVFVCQFVCDTQRIVTHALCWHA